MLAGMELACKRLRARILCLLNKRERFDGSSARTRSWEGTAMESKARWQLGGGLFQLRMSSREHQAPLAGQARRNRQTAVAGQQFIGEFNIDFRWIWQYDRASHGRICRVNVNLAGILPDTQAGCAFQLGATEPYQGFKVFK